MPSRLVVFGIVVFWLASATWLVVREVVPRFQAADAPPFEIDLTDEVGANSITWIVYHQGAKVGGGISHVRRGPDRTFDFLSKFHFDKFKLFNKLQIRELSNRYRVTPAGRLVEAGAKVYVGEFFGLGGEIKGNVVDGDFHPEVHLIVNNKPQKVMDLDPVKISGHGTILNPMHLINRLSGLRQGQRWTIPLLDPVSSVLPGKKVTIPLLIAEVFSTNLEWAGEDFACFRIDYWEPGKKVTASTWVRRLDGLVLQQEAGHEEMNLVLVRDPSK